MFGVGRKASPQRIGAAGGEGADGVGVEPAARDHDRVPLRVDAAATRAPSELGELPRSECSACSTPLNFTSFSSTTDRAGMLMPSARVSVAKTALSRPRANSSSTTVLSRGRIPAWWAA